MLPRSRTAPPDGAAPRRPGRLLALALVVVLVAGVLSCSSPTDPDDHDSPVDPLTQWSRAPGEAGSAPAVWVAYGDSITEGQGASTRQHRWIDQTATSLRDRYPGSGAATAATYLPGWYAVFSPDSPWQPYVGRTGTVTNDSTGCLGLRTATLSEGATQTFALEGSAADLYYLADGGTLTYSVDGGPPTRLDTAGVASGPVRERIGLAPSGPHRVSVGAASGTVHLCGVAGHDGDRGSGVHLFDGSHSGYTAQQFVEAQADLAPVLRLVEPDLVTIELGVNDYLRGEASATEVAADLRTLVAGIREAMGEKPPSIVLVLPYRIGLGSEDPAARWDDYVAATAALGPELSVGVLDLSAIGTSAPGGLWSSDGLHASDAGNAEMARRATTYLAGG